MPAFELTIPRSRIFVVLPAFNEEHNIGRLLQRISLVKRESVLDYRAIVVDDGSWDDTCAIVADFAASDVMLYRHNENRGLGVTIFDGLAEAARQAHKDDVIITMDGDDSHPPGLIDRMVKAVREGHDVVVASRFQRGSRVEGLSFGRRVLSFSASLFLRILFPTKGLRDYTCGYRAYSAAVIQLAIAEYGNSFVDSKGFSCMVEIILKLRRMGVVFGEVPLILRYDRKEGFSKMRVWRTISQTLDVVRSEVQLGGRATHLAMKSPGARRNENT